MCRNRTNPVFMRLSNDLQYKNSTYLKVNYITSLNLTLAKLYIEYNIRPHFTFF